MNKFELTYEVLKACKRAGYHKVTIGKPDPTNNPACRSWTNGPESLWGWHPVFGGSFHSSDKKEDRDICHEGQCPAIWRIAERFKIYGGCGNSHQSQLKCNSPILRGTWDLTRHLNSIRKELDEEEKKEYLEAI